MRTAMYWGLKMNLTTEQMRGLHYFAAVMSMIAAMIEAKLDNFPWVLFGIVIAFLNVFMAELLTEKE